MAHNRKETVARRTVVAEQWLRGGCKLNAAARRELAARFRVKKHVIREDVILIRDALLWLASRPARPATRVMRRTISA